MKSKLYIIVMAFFSGFLTAHGEQDITKIWKDPDPLLREIRSHIEMQDRNPSEDDALAADIQTLAYAISQELIAADSPDWATPSAERKAVIQKWANILEPESQKLVDLAFGEEFGKTQSSIQARSLLNYALPSPAFADQIKRYIHQSPWVAFAAANLLYEHRLLTDADKAALREWRPETNREADLERWAVGMGAFGMQDGLEIAKRALAIDPHGETPEEIFRQYRNSLEIANNLGPDAAVLLPEIEALIAHPAIISSGYLRHFEYARDIVGGKQPRQGRYAVNGSGPLGANSLARSSAPTPAVTAAQTTPVPPTTKPVQQLKAVASPTPTAETPSSSGFPIMLVAIVGAALLGIVIYVLRRKSP